MILKPQNLLPTKALLALYSVLTLIMAFAFSWIILAQSHFLYGIWHDYGGIAEGIEQYGPQNRFRQDFAATTRTERIRIFAAINRAIHRGGEGLEDIVYRLPERGVEHLLLREPEIVHLRDVAILIDKLRLASAVSLLLWLGLLLYFVKSHQSLPSLKQQFFYVLGILLLALALILLLGPVKVFYTLHIWIFPAEHQWFFYYQDSLMSTMMLAPVLFAWVGIVWLLLAFMLFVLMVFLVNRLMRYFHREYGQNSEAA